MFMYIYEKPCTILTIANVSNERSGVRINHFDFELITIFRNEMH